MGCSCLAIGCLAMPSKLAGSVPRFFMEKIENKKFEIIIDSKLDNDTNDILSRYWKFDGTEFPERIGEIGKKYDRYYTQLLQVVKKSSKAIIADYCLDCGVELKIEVTSQTKFMETYRGENRCNDCKEIHEKYLTQKKGEDRLRYYKNRILKFNKSVEERAWEKLSLEENRLLLRIIEAPNQNIDFGNFEYLPNSEKLKLVDKFISLGLIDPGLEHDSEDNDFCFSPILPNSLKQYLKPFDSKSNEHYSKEWSRISFELKRNQGFRNSNTPLYNGTITFNQDVIIKAGTKCLYGVWARENDNTWLSVTPVSDIIVSQNNSIDNEPEPTRSILDRFLNNR